MIKNLQDYKEEKNSQEKQKELHNLCEKLNDCIDILKIYNKHVNIMECLSILHNSRTLFEIQLNRERK